MRTQVCIVGAGPAGLTLAHLLHRQGIECVVLERRSRAHIETRVRAGVLEQPTVDLYTSLGLADRLHREGMVHHGINLRFDGGTHRIDVAALTGGKGITVYGQQEVVTDLLAALAPPVFFEVADVRIDGGRVTLVHDGAQRSLRADFVAGCDGFRGVSREAAGPLTVHEREYPFAWLGILARTKPAGDELIYARHPDGFALHSMRGPALTRQYLQVPAGTSPADWPDERIWAALRRRLDDPALETGEIVDRGVTAMRSFVASPLRHGNLLLAGDAAHIVPATGAKGLNLAVADAVALSYGLGAFYAGSPGELDRYSDRCLERVWRVQHFSWWMTSLLHRLDDDAFDRRLRHAELTRLVTSDTAARELAENYVGLPHPVSWSWR